MGSSAVMATRMIQAAMQMDHVATAGTLVKVIHVLRDNGKIGNMVLHSRDRTVGRIGLATQHPTTSPFIPAPNQLGVGFKCLRSSQLLGIKVFPKSRQYVPECRD